MLLLSVFLGVFLSPDWCPKNVKFFLLLAAVESANCTFYGRIYLLAVFPRFYACFYLFVFCFRFGVFLVCVCVFFFLFCFVFFFLPFRAAPATHEGPRLGVKSELWLPAYTTVTATRDPSHVCNLHHSSWQCRILNPLDEARARTHILMDTSSICYPWATTRIPYQFLFGTTQIYIHGGEVGFSYTNTMDY